jgi:hypothetical protein
MKRSVLGIGSVTGCTCGAVRLNRKQTLLWPLITCFLNASRQQVCVSLALHNHHYLRSSSDVIGVS